MKYKSLLFLPLILLALGFQSSVVVAACSETSIGLNETKNGELSSSDCTAGDLLGGTDISKVDVYTLNVSSAATVTLKMRSTAFDSLLRVYNSDFSTKLAEDDDSLSGMDALISDLALDPGTYKIVANSSNFNSEVLGAYTVETSGTGGGPTIETVIVSSVLPASRSVKVGNSATAFATVINAGTKTATQCGLALDSNIDASFSYQTTDPATNKSVGNANTPADIAVGKFQTYIFTITPNSAFAPQDVAIRYSCSNSEKAATTVGLNTLLLSASNSDVADIVALVATPEDPGIANLPDATATTPAIFSVASVNVGSASDIFVTVDTGSATYDHTALICQTNPGSGVCENPTVPSTNLVELNVKAGETPTFAVFLYGKEQVNFDPANNRLFIRFKDQNNTTRGATSVAVRTTQ